MMKPKSLRACMQLILPEIEGMLMMGTAREDIYTEICQRYGLEKTSMRTFDSSLYRARKKAGKKEGVLHNTGSDSDKVVLHNTEHSEADNSVLHNTEHSEPNDSVTHNTESNTKMRTAEELEKMQSEIDYNQFKTNKF